MAGQIELAVDMLDGVGHGRDRDTKHSCRLGTAVARTDDRGEPRLRRRKPEEAECVERIVAVLTFGVDRNHDRRRTRRQVHTGRIARNRYRLHQQRPLSARAWQDNRFKRAHIRARLEGGPQQAGKRRLMIPRLCLKPPGRKRQTVADQPLGRCVGKDDFRLVVDDPCGAGDVRKRLSQALLHRAGTRQAGRDHERARRMLAKQAQTIELALLELPAIERTHHAEGDDEIRHGRHELAAKEPIPYSRQNSCRIGSRATPSGVNSSASQQTPSVRPRRWMRSTRVS